MKDKVLFKNDWFNVIERDGMIGISPNSLNVVVMAFERDAAGLPRTIGIRDEMNPLRDGARSLTLVTGGSEDEDPDVLATAKRELEEESGYKVDDPDRWYFLGFMTTSKLVAHSSPCFACDVTGLERGEAKGDGTRSEAESSFKMLPTNDALDTDDCYIPTLFLKMFRFLFGNKTNTNEPLQQKGPEGSGEADGDLRKDGGDGEDAGGGEAGKAGRDGGGA